MTDQVTPLPRRWWSQLTQARVRRQRRQAQIDQLAETRLAADERQLTRHRGRSLSLRGAAKDFWHHPSPWILAGSLVTATVARLLVGDFQASDLLVPALMVASFPFVEWVVHVFVLHWKPREVAGVTIDPLLAREHRAHHADPRDLPLVFIPWPVYLWLLPTLVAIGLLAFPRLGLGLTYLLALTVIGSVYEWVHYLIHSDYRPVTRPYKAVWRNHRLHHYKNENYWFTVTTAGTADRVLGTYPDPAEVPNSPTAKDLAAR